MIILDMEQRSPEWFDARRGIPTASALSKVITPKTGKLSAQCDEYIGTLIADLVDCEIEEDSFSNAWMERGMFLEEEARDWYAFQNDVAVDQVGFIMNDDKTAGVSPDGIVKDIGLLEIKCPKPAVHVKYLLNGGLPDLYKPQVHGALHISGAAWVDFISYCPGFASLVVRVLPDEYTEKVGVALQLFIDRLESAKEKIIPKAA